MSPTDSCSRESTRRWLESQMSLASWNSSATPVHRNLPPTQRWLPEAKQLRRLPPRGRNRKHMWEKSLSFMAQLCSFE